MANFPVGVQLRSLEIPVMRKIPAAKKSSSASSSWRGDDQRISVDRLLSDSIAQ